MPAKRRQSDWERVRELMANALGFVILARNESQPGSNRHKNAVKLYEDVRRFWDARYRRELRRRRKRTA